MERGESLNRLFYTKMVIPNVNKVTIDPDKFDMISPDVMTIDNSWNIVVLMSLLTKNTGKYVLYKADWETLPANQFYGKQIHENLRKCIRSLHEETEPSTLSRVLDDADDKLSKDT